MRSIVFVSIFLFSFTAIANPYPKESEVPKDNADAFSRDYEQGRKTTLPGEEVLRIDLSWHPNETYEVTSVRRERSGTPALKRAAANPDPIGSFRGELADPMTGRAFAFAAMGTGADFRKLTRGISLRFPVPETISEFRFFIENPSTGETELELTQLINPHEIAPAETGTPADLEVRLLKEAAVEPALHVNVYAEGYLTGRKSQFWKDAARVVSALEQKNFPGFSRMRFHAVFHPSTLPLGNAENLGLPVPARDSFLGLYFPYWQNFGRWYHVIYPTREERYRDALGLVAYDYPLVVVDDANYWGVGNFKELTAIPSGNWSFTYLLLHEFGHFFGLNEEYEGGGATELAFAPGIAEPWSQNITFSTDLSSLKWASFVKPGTPIPTPDSHWSKGRYGAYRGGYAETEPLNRSHKPGHDCVMKNGDNFCPICRHAIEERIAFDLGETITKH